MSNFYAIVSGVGPGTGRHLALRFSKTYPVVLLARSQTSLDPIAQEIRALGGEALPIRADNADKESVAAAFRLIEETWPGRKLVAAVFNPLAGFVVKPFLELKEGDLDASLDGSAKGFFNFAQQTIPHLQASTSLSPPHPPSLLVTGGSVSVSGALNLSTFSAGKFAQRGLVQSIAREFGPKGVHVAIVLVDGLIETPMTDGWTVNDGVEDGKVNPEAIAETFWHLHTQHRSAFSLEVDLRPYVQKF